MNDDGALLLSSRARKPDADFEHEGHSGGVVDAVVVAVVVETAPSPPPKQPPTRAAKHSEE